MDLLEVDNLHTYFDTKRGTVKAVKGVTFSLKRGKTLGIVGESGSWTSWMQQILGTVTQS